MAQLLEFLMLADKLFQSCFGERAITECGCSKSGTVNVMVDSDRSERVVL